jgi:hypothetical protein
MRNLTATHSLTLLQMQTSSDTQSWH